MKGAIRDFKDLIVWQKAVAFVREVYRLSKVFPPEERFGLTNQVRRAAVSVPSNISEGHAGQGREFARFLSIARGSLGEAETQLLLAVELGYLRGEQTLSIRNLADEIRRMLCALAARVSPRP